MTDDLTPQEQTYPDFPKERVFSLDFSGDTGQAALGKIAAYLDAHPTVVLIGLWNMPGLATNWETLLQVVMTDLPED